MPDMPECLTQPMGTGLADMCRNPEVAATFPLTCAAPPRPAAVCP